MKEQIKKFLNEEQDPKAIDKISNKLEDLLMKNEEVGYIGVQKKPVTVFPDSIVLTNKRIIICKPKNLGFSMEFVDYNWDSISHTFVNESILGSEFSFTTKTDLTISIDYLPKIQARKIYTFAKEQLDELKTKTAEPLETVFQAQIVESIAEEIPKERTEDVVEEIDTEEVTDFAEIVPVSLSGYRDEKQFPDVNQETKESGLSHLSQDELFEKLQNYKKLLDNGLIMQGEYDALKKEVLSHM
ncbi:PH domain-containing protein [Flavobacterium antarcticum]|uniref:PH domain-containing protein n=1 Tax=Flavobacterium antarcticum TaxID=271155 RepID=UPI0003B6F354|nr:PH domain-containing protein [Flavobacterium antarcticum]